MNHISHRWVTETRCACCGAQSGTVIGSGVCARFEQDPKPEPLPHEWATYEVPGIEKGFRCVHCELETLDPFSVQGTCARTAPNEEEKQKRIAANLRAAFKDYSSSPPAQKAEALPVNVAAVYWLSDAICRSAAYSPATVQKAIYNLIEHILAEVDKRFDRRDDAIGDRVAGLLLSNADAMGLIARDEISKAVAHAFNANVDDFVPRPDLYRIVPGKESE